jgi:hypothetical protein
MSILISDVNAFTVGKIGTISPSIHAKLELDKGSIPGGTDTEKEDTMRRRIIRRIYGELETQFEKFLKEAFPDGEPPTGKAVERRNKIRMLLKGEGRRVILGEATTLAD